MALRSPKDSKLRKTIYIPNLKEIDITYFCNSLVQVAHVQVLKHQVTTMSLNQIQEFLDETDRKAQMGIDPFTVESQLCILNS